MTLMIFSLLSGQVRKLIMVSQGAMTLPGWQQGKVQTQAKKYGLPKLLHMHADLLNLDYRQKTSASAFDMSMGLQLWVSKLQLP